MHITEPSKDVWNNYVLVSQQFLATLLHTLQYISPNEWAGFPGVLVKRGRLHNQSNGTGHGKDTWARLTNQTM